MSGTALPPIETPTIVTGAAQSVVVPPEPVAQPVLETPTIVTPPSAPITPESTPVATETPVVEPVVAPEGEKKPDAAADETKPPAYTDKPTLIEATEAEKPDEKAVEEPKKPEEEPKKAEESAKPPETVAEPVKYEPFKLPEGVTVDEDRIAKFTDVIGPHKLDQDTAQRLIDLHTETLDAFRQHLQAEQLRIFEETKASWLTRTMADPVLGGAGHQTALQAAARMRDLLVPESDREDFIDMLRASGVGDHPAMFRLLHNAARLFDEPAAPPIQARPVPDRGGNAAPSRSQIMYDHPTSRRVAGGNR